MLGLFVFDEEGGENCVSLTFRVNCFVDSQNFIIYFHIIIALLISII